MTSTNKEQVQEKGTMETEKEQTGGRKPQESSTSGVNGRTGVVINNLGFAVQMYLGLNSSIAT